MLDEPVAGLSDAETAHTAGLDPRLKRSDRAILVIEHDMAFVERSPIGSRCFTRADPFRGGMAGCPQPTPASIDVFLGR